MDTIFPFLQTVKQTALEVYLQNAQNFVARAVYSSLFRTK